MCAFCSPVYQCSFHRDWTCDQIGMPHARGEGRQYHHGESHKVHYILHHQPTVWRYRCSQLQVSGGTKIQHIRKKQEGLLAQVKELIRDQFVLTHHGKNSHWLITGGQRSIVWHFGLDLDHKPQGRCTDTYRQRKDIKSTWLIGLHCTLGSFQTDTVTPTAFGRLTFFPGNDLGSRVSTTVTWAVSPCPFGRWVLGNSDND